MKRIQIAGIFICFLLLVFADLAPAKTVVDQVSGNIKERIKTSEVSPTIKCGEGIACESALLPKFYSERDFQPAWSDDYGPTPYVKNFLDVIRVAYREGLNPEDYHPGKIKAVITELNEHRSKGEPLDAVRLTDLDLMLTDAFLLYASHLLEGRVDHQHVYPGWVISERSTDLTAVLHYALESGAIKSSLADLAPAYKGYTRLKEKLDSYRHIAGKGGWPKIPKGPMLHKGSHGKRVAILRQRLIASGDLSFEAPILNIVFDHNLEKAVSRFQMRHGLKGDGRVGKATLEVLNISIGKRIRQIALNMDRMRWLPDEIGERYIFVNVADFSLKVIDDEKVIMAMKIIAGKGEQRSCIISGEMTYMELNPYWRIPDSIAAKEILPQIKKNPGYLTEKRIKVFKDWAEADEEKAVDPKKVKWSSVKASNLGYKFRQESGPTNPLGRIKFIFPNLCEIYLHDTPARHLFGQSRRDLSHGCIRIEKPVELATYLLKNKETWTRKKILAEIKKEKRQVVMLPEPINVHIFYGTAWVDQDGELQFRSDIYRIDDVPYKVPIGIR
ncbi:MAG TPA: L,D-transpeptidase family protein [Syntrophales bacterium]|nr:L,D-transpeptidase family protein [Syntrophales bacterium]